MSNRKGAEFLLRGILGRHHHDEIVGDLLETYHGYSTVRFWFALSRVATRFIWRPLVSLLLAFATCFFTGFELSTTAIRSFSFGDSSHVPMLLKCIWFVNQDASLWALAAFSFFRYGLRDYSWWVGTLYACLCMFYVYSLWTPSLQSGFYACLLVAVLVSVSTRLLRRASVVVAISLVCCVATKSFLSWVLVLRNIRQTLSGHELISAFALAVVPPMIAFLTFSVLHKRLFAVNRLTAQADL